MDKQERVIKYIKLNNGEDLVSEIETENELEYTLINPMKIVVNTDLESSRQLIFLHPWLPTGVVTENSAQIHASVIFLTSTVLQDIEDYYTNMVDEISMNETIKKKSKRKKSKIQKNVNLDEENNILNFVDLLERLKKNKPIH